MKRSYSIKGLIGALALGTVAGAAIGVSLLLNRGNSTRQEIAKDTKNLAKNLRKKAQKKAKNTRKEEWLANEKDKIMNHAK